MSKKVVFLDVDGTLCLDDATTVPQSAIDACIMARRNGHKLYLCTGRSKPEIFSHILEIGFDGIIGAGGGFCEHEGEMVFHKQVSESQLKHAVEFFHKHNISYYLESNGGLYGALDCVNILKQKLYGDLSEEELDEAYKANPHPFISTLKDGNVVKYPKEVNKICFLGNDTIPFRDIQSEFEDEFEVIHCTVPLFGDNSGELAVAGVNKANAIEALLNYLNMDHKDTIAIGDGLNDIEMFTYCNTGIAMGNAEQQLKDIADDITARHDEDGIYKAFQKYSLI